MVTASAASCSEVVTVMGRRPSTAEYHGSRRRANQRLFRAVDRILFRRQLWVIGMEEIDEINAKPRLSAGCNKFRRGFEHPNSPLGSSLDLLVHGYLNKQPVLGYFKQR